MPHLHRRLLPLAALALGATILATPTTAHRAKKKLLAMSVEPKEQSVRQYRKGQRKRWMTT